MPYKRMTKPAYRRKATRRKATRRKPVSNRRALTRIVKRVVQYQEETKFFEYCALDWIVGASGAYFVPLQDRLTGVAVPAPANSSCLLGLQNGNTRTTRNGQAVYSMYINCRGNFSPNSVVAPGEIIKIIVVHDKQPNGAAFAVTNIYDNNDPFNLSLTPPPSRVNCCAPRAFDQAKRFTILKELKFTFPVGTSFPQGFNFNIPVNRKIQYQGSTGGVADLQVDNVGLFFLRMSDATNMITLDGFTVRHYFKDS